MGSVNFEVPMSSLHTRLLLDSSFFKKLFLLLFIFELCKLYKGVEFVEILLSAFVNLHTAQRQ